MTPAAAAPTLVPWRILCDFDGTITLEDVIDGLLERFGMPGWQGLEEDWIAGRIGSRECMQGQVALLDVGRAELDAHLDTLRIDPDFGAFVAAARALGHEVSIVSDGIDYAIHRLLRRHRLPPLAVAANRWLPTESPRRWRLASPYEAADCASGTCKCARVQQARERGAHPVLLIGDGRSDFCASQAADLVFAKGKLVDHCRQQRVPHQPIAGFGAALELLPRLDAWLAA
jgi:2-hydroxy-3-keto-5-methylthiopentenyl-1-phosphate phosphatase